ncbi:MAG TPA: lysylphosphatidylglycerol synthase transmembrane domain-containing protein [Thermomicrobiales bacterium]|nr:lysylphosphatidylglycerol synthase transmembrane domain-containing protein [Thermomicrobiales bacterium]
MDRVKRAFSWLREHAHPNIVLPVLVGAGLLAYVASLASAPKNAAALWATIKQVWWLVLLLTFPYLVARLYVWNALMRELGVRVPFRQALLAFAGGEMTKSLPGGIYVENYLLKRLTHMDEKRTVRSSAATTAILGLEATLALLVVLVAGIPGVPWVRWGLLVVVGVWLLLIAGLRWLIHLGAERSADLPGWLAHVRRDAAEFLKDGRALLRWRTLLNLGPTALYMFIYAVDLHFISAALGLPRLGWVAVVTVYAAMVLAVVLVPIPTEIGIAEISVLGALAGFGVEHHQAAVVALALRILATGATILVSGIVFLALRGELREADQEAAAGAGDDRADTERGDAGDDLAPTHGERERRAHDQAPD